MAEIISKAKLQLRVSGSTNGERTTAGANSKLLINHGKPNFTIQRSPSRVQQNGEVDATFTTSQPNKNYKNSNNTNNEGNSDNNNNNNGTIALNGNERETLNGNDDNSIFRGSRFNGILKSPNSGISVNARQTHYINNNNNNNKNHNNNNNNNNSNSNINSTIIDNEATRVVLRRTIRPPAPSSAAKEHDSVPEFILRQRRIQERLAKENVLDFEKRRSGYFTQVMISPTSPSRTSFVETMASPAIVPALETQPQPQPQPMKESGAILESSTKVNQPVVASNEEQHPRDDSQKKEEDERTVQELAKKKVQVTVNGNILEESKKQESVEEKRKIDEQISNDHESPALINCSHSKNELSDISAKQEQQQQQNQLQKLPLQATEQALEEEEVAKAIEEVNKAVAGEEDAMDESCNSPQILQAKTTGSDAAAGVPEASLVAVMETVNDSSSIVIDDVTKAAINVIPESRKDDIFADPVHGNIDNTSTALQREQSIHDQTKTVSSNEADADISTYGQFKSEIKGEDDENVGVTPSLRKE